MFTEFERAEIRALFYTELIKIHEAMQKAGSYHYLCLINGHPTYCHEPHGKTLWHTPWV